MPCQTLGALRTSSCVCLVSGGMAKTMMVVVIATSASISRITLTKRGTRCFCNQTTIGLRTIARRKTNAKSKITGCSERRINQTMNSVAVAELILNLAWAAVALTAFVILLPQAAARRRKHAIAALLCCVALLFPIISLSDDLGADRVTFEVLAAVLVAIALIIGLTAIARITVRPFARVSFVVAKHADPRSPPAR